MSSSPLLRCPGLFYRKLFRRFVPFSPPGFKNAPDDLKYVPPSRVADVLQHLLDGNPPVRSVPGYNHVFGQEFDFEALWRFCRNGPDSGTGDLRSDIKLPWEFSRLYVFPLHALAAQKKERVAGDLAAFFDEWWSHNSDVNGVNWTCAMEVAIRAVNLLFADAILDGELAGSTGESVWAQRLWQHGCIIWNRLEIKLRHSSNHYLADLLGLYCIGCVFPRNKQAKKWKRFAHREMQRAVLAQTYQDGGVYEASLPYHALVTEMALWFSAIAKKESLSLAFRERMEKMCQVVADCSSGDGDLFCVGDDDSGRIIAFDMLCSAGRGQVLLKLAEQLFKKPFVSNPQACFPESGWAVLRTNHFCVHMENGPVGMNDLGSHAHADDLSIVVEYRGRPILVDSGSGLYTSNPMLRNQLRSAEAHNTMSCANELYHWKSNEADDLFRLLQKCKCARFVHVTDDQISALIKSDSGIEMSRVVTARNTSLVVQDSVRGASSVSWSFVFCPEIEVSVDGSRFKLRIPDGSVLTVSFDLSVELSLKQVPVSRFYGSTTTAFCGEVRTMNGKSLRWELGRWR